MTISIDTDGNIDGYVYLIKDVLKEKFNCKWNQNICNWVVSDRTNIQELKFYIEEINKENNSLVKCGYNGCEKKRKKCFKTCYNCRVGDSECKKIIN